jgi:hypothetical protein
LSSNGPLVPLITRIFELKAIDETATSITCNRGSLAFAWQSPTDTSKQLAQEEQRVTIACNGGYFPVLRWHRGELMAVLRGHLTRGMLAALKQRVGTARETGPKAGSCNQVLID